MSDNKILENQIRSNNIFQAYIFECPNADAEQICRDFFSKINKGSGVNNIWVDYKGIFPDKNSIAIEKIRELKKEAFEKPLATSRRLHVIYRSDCMKKEAQNALLKTLEESPAYTIIVLATENAGKLEGTIRSRCQLIKFDKSELKAAKTGDRELKKKTLELINAALRGEYYRCVSIKDFIASIDDKKSFIGLLSSIFEQVLNIKYNIGVRESLGVEMDSFKGLLTLSNNKIENSILKIDQISRLLDANVNLQLAFEDFLLGLMEDR